MEFLRTCSSTIDEPSRFDALARAERIVIQRAVFSAVRSVTRFIFLEFFLRLEWLLHQHTCIYVCLCIFFEWAKNSGLFFSFVLASLAVMPSREVVSYM